MKQNLFTWDASGKLKRLLDEINICIFTTTDYRKRKDFSGLMPTTKVEEDGTIWLFTNKNYRRISEIETNSALHLLYAHPGKKNYVNVWGNAMLIEDYIKINELWSPVVKAWFPEGKNNSNICLIKVEPEKAHYWDSNTNQCIALN